MQVAVFIPCFNEEITVAQVVRDFRAQLPTAEIFVFDNNSTDQTRMRAAAAGATVVASQRQGKGYVVRHAFEMIEADILVMVDGDNTYPAEEVTRLIHPLVTGTADMVVGMRLNEHSQAAFRRFHLFGNRFFSWVVSRVFGESVGDMLSGYRAFTREFVKSLPLNSKGFEVETDLTLQAISKGFRISEVALPYRERPEGSFSKLKTFGDGFLILKFIGRLARDYRPLPFFTIASALCLGLSLVSGWAPIQDYLQFSYVYTVPRAILAAGLGVLASVLFGVGLILDAQIRSFNDQFILLRRVLKESPRAKELRVVTPTDHDAQKSKKSAS